jgi:phosphopantothenoylcysteine decarboxylase / phosphopantothenate---cysteine ligase
VDVYRFRGILMASVTIRNLEGDAKQKLRERAARHGNSMEEELRMIIRSVISDDPASTAPRSENLYDSIRSLVDPHGSFELNLPHRSVPAAQDGNSILLIISGGIAAYKSLDLIRRLRERGFGVRAVMTKAAQEFVTPLSVGALTADKVFTDLFSREDEQDVGHIRLARECDLIVVAPASADLMAKMANGLANDLASAVLLAANKPVLIAPAMNPAMWSHAATRRNRTALAKDGIHFIGPNKGEMAESGEAGEGRMAEPLEIVAAIEALLNAKPKLLAGKKIIVTSGPTHEPIDPVRYIANRSSGKQGHAIAAALAALGADVRLVSGPVTIADPADVSVTRVETARQMLAAVERLLPVDAAIMVAAVADWRTENESGEKIKKEAGKGAPALLMTENPDILKTVGHHKQRPGLVIGFAAETQNLIENANSKLARKGADMIVANDVSAETGVMGGDRNRVQIVSASGVEEWPEMGKDEVAVRLAEMVAAKLAAQ